MGSAVAAAAFGALMTGGGVSDSPAQAAIAPQERSGAILAYRIPAGSVASALNVIADENDLHVLYDARLTHGRMTPGLSGKYSVREALGALLAGTGLTYEFSRDGQAVSIVLAQNDAATQNDASGATPLPTIDIGAQTGRKDGAPSGGRAAPGPGDRYTGYNAASAPTTLKVDTPLLKTPLAVEVVTRQTMDDQQAISVGDAVLTNVSGVTPLPNLLDVYKVRGFSVSQSTYKNGLIELRSRYLDTANLQSIDVLKGPAAMLFGRSEPGGLINLVVKRPLETPYYSIQQQAQSYGGARTTIDATGPLTADKSLLYRVNAEYYRTDSYRDFVTDRNFFVAPTISYRPIEQFRINVDFEYQNKTWVDDYELLPAVYDHPANIPISRYLSAPYLTTNLKNHFDKKRIAYDWTYDISKDWSLTNRLSYTSVGTRNGNVAGAAFNQITGVLNRTYVYFPGNTDNTFATNLDLKGKFETGPLSHSVLVGFDYFSNYWGMKSQIITPISAINIYAPNYYTLDVPRGGGYAHSGEQWTGVYGQDMISFLDDSVHVLLGGRYDWNAVSSSGGYNSNWLTGYSNYKTAYSSAFSPRVGVVYQPLPWMSVYGNFAQSFGSNNTTNYSQPQPPQRGEIWEAGAKAELLDKRLTLTMAYFDITKTNIPTADPLNTTITYLIGKARSQGFEFDLTGRIDDNWSVIANYTHDDVRTVEGSSANALTVYNSNLAVAGKVLASSPRNYGNLWVKYDADDAFKGLSLGAGLTVTGSALGDNANSYVLPGYALLNGMIAYTTKIEGFNVTAQLNVKNITDTVYYPASQDRTYIMTGAPRSFLGSLRLEF
ncbi:TonB-dependent receptor [Methylosinus sp. LW3]|uniref:TonB-dependent siderophore receptor n=1 Tax=Methylosinus sp. LW3 TaxID=107635 RepID=UPI0004653A5C|nr:TonB-dependent receptor [Methylosinus sp. LW3]